MPGIRFGEAGMKDSRPILDNLLSSLPDRRDELLPYVADVKKYSSECGCSLGGKFLIASAALWALRWILFIPHSPANLFKQLVLGILFIFCSSILGKLTGITVAKIRLALLYRHLRFMYRLEGE
jgi:hypothetical protein